MSRYRGDRIVADGLFPGRYERMRDSCPQPLAAFVAGPEDKVPPVPSLHGRLRAQVIADAATRSLRAGVPVPVVY